MGKDSGEKTQKSTTSTAPWGPQATRYQTGLSDLDRLRSSGALRINPYPGQTIADRAPETEQAWAGIAQRAQAGSPLNAMSGDYVQRVLDPNYLTSDSPGLSSVIDSARQGVNAQFAMGGRTFSPGAHGNALASSEGQLRYQDLVRKAGEQQAAAQFAPQLAAQDYFDLAQLQGVGTERQGYMQDLINSDINRFNALQQAPINELALYNSLIGGNLGGTTTATQPVQGGNTAAGVIGGLGQIAASVPWYLL
jgi:hypothetical protein